VLALILTPMGVYDLRQRRHGRRVSVSRGAVAEADLGDVDVLRGVGPFSCGWLRARL